MRVPFGLVSVDGSDVEKAVGRLFAGVKQRRSKYDPHQGTKERARRERQAQRAADKQRATATGSSFVDKRPTNRGQTNNGEQPQP